MGGAVPAHVVQGVESIGHSGDGGCYDSVVESYKKDGQTEVNDDGSELETSEMLLLQRFGWAVERIRFLVDGEHLVLPIFFIARIVKTRRTRPA